MTDVSETVTEYRRRSDLAAEWLLRSIDACGGAGSAAYYSRWYQPRRGWSAPYPETTGYIIETLLHYARATGQGRFADVAVRQADWVRSLQSDDGALPGGLARQGQPQPPSIFNTGQMILGLVAAADHTQEDVYLQSARRAAQWLASEVDAEQGMWTRHAYVAGYHPAYYSRVAWPMLEVWKRTGDETIKAASQRVLATIQKWQLPNGAFRNWEFSPGKPAFTHTIAYTIRGLWESSLLLADEGGELYATALRAADALRRRAELRGRLAGAYDQQLRGTYWYTCLTGNCQMAIIWMRVYGQNQDARYLSAALKALAPVLRRQKQNPVDRNQRGAIAGSAPLWGRYLSLRYPNWATKFLLDALLLAQAQLTELVESGPCVSR